MVTNRVRIFFFVLAFLVRMIAFVQISEISAATNSHKEDNIQYDGSIVLLSIPKSGTFFIKNFVTNLFSKECIHTHPHLFNLTYNKNIPTDPEDIFFSANQFLTTHRESKVIFLYRDLRDVLVSYLRWIDEQPKEGWNFKFYGHKDWDSWTAEEKLCELIEGSKFPILQEDIRSIREIWKSFPSKCNVSMIRFEDVIGSLAGGDQKLQFDILSKLIQFLDHDSVFHSSILEKIIQESWGNSVTFNSPLIGRWKSFFTEKVKRKFKDSFWNNILIELGYENSLDW